MDRNTIKTLLMTTSVVAIVAGSAQEATAACGVDITSSQAGFTQTTNVNCIEIHNSTITSDVTINPPATVGPGLSNFEVFIDNSVLQGGLFNNSTILGDVGSGSSNQLTNFRISLTNGSTVSHGITNGASTGFIDIAVSNTHINAAATVSATATGIGVGSLFTGNVVNNGTINVSAFVDPTPTAVANATGMGVISTSFVGNVINTHVLNVSATAIAGSGTAAFATSGARGILISAGSHTGNLSFAGAGTTARSFSALFQGNVTNSGVINTFAQATALADLAGPGAAATAVADGILISGQSFNGSFTNTGSGTLIATLSDLVSGNITNNGTIQSNATAWAANGSSGAPITGGNATATALAHAFGIRLLGDQLTGNLTQGSVTSISNLFSTVTADFAVNITNTDLIDANALARATAFSSGGTALATATARGAGIEAIGAVVVTNVSVTSLGNITDTYNGTFAGNIVNAGAINAIITALGTVGAASGLAEATVRQTGAGISVIGATFNGNVSDIGTGNITNNLNATFLGNITNSGGITVHGTASGSATNLNSAGTAAVVINSNDAGISVTGGVFSGNVTATSTGSVNNALTDTFTGNITNAASGNISVTGVANGLSTIETSGGSASASVHASAGGIRLLGGSFSGNRSGNVSNRASSVIFNGNVTNNGTIQTTALAFATLQGSTGSLHLTSGADAHGIAVIGAVFSDNALRVGTFTGNILNTGKVSAFASAVGQVSNLAATSISVQASASADGILAILQRFNGNITSTGSINAAARASVFVNNSLNSSFGGTSALAFADGIDVRASTFTGNIGNSAGVIRAFANATDNAEFALVSADANGIYLEAITHNGNISNTGLILVASGAMATNIGSPATVVAAGISAVITGGEGFNGTITNGSGAGIQAIAVATADTLGVSTATGIAVDASRMFGDVVNNGAIEARASATALSATTSTATAHAAGIHVGDAGGPFMSSFIGNVNNTGVMSAFSTAHSNEFATAMAEGVLVANTANGLISDVRFVSGNISNTGTVSAKAFATAHDTAFASAGGMVLAASIFVGNVTNGGTIVAQSQAQVTNPFSTAIGGFATATADAAGIDIIGGTHTAGLAFLFLGDVTNTSSGVISASAVALVPASTLFGGAGRAHASGVLLSGLSFDTNMEFIGISTIVGNVTNQGLIMSRASVDVGGFGATANAVAAGIEALFSSFTGNVSNSGTVVATAIANMTDGTADATAGGIVLAGFDLNGFLGLASTFTGGVTNSGRVDAIARAAGLNHGSAVAFGAFIGASSIIGDVTNTSTGVIAADAGATAAFPGGSGDAEAGAVGIYFNSETLLGNVSNAGTISANASASVTNSNVANALAASYGIWSNSSTFIGNIANTGFIGAFGTANASVNAFGSVVNNGTAHASVDVAGIRLTGILGIGTIANSGTLVQVSTFVGNVKNAGTIMAIGTAIAHSGTAFAQAFDPATGIRIEVSTFAGLVANNGLIVAQGTASATGGNNSAAVALAAGIAVNAVIPNSDALFSTRSYLGMIANTGTIMVDARAVVSANAGTAFVAAGATGIRVFADTFSGGISNSGMIQATATAINNSATGFAEEGAFAAGIHIGGIGPFNSKGPNPGNFATISTFTGDVSNTGTIKAFATSFNTDDVYAAGIQVDTSVGMTGNITNSSKGVISAQAFITGPGTVFGTADGIYLAASRFIGNVTNDGTIVASATAANATNAHARAVGIELPFGSLASLVGNISNTGQIQASAFANAAAAGTAFAGATAVGIDADANTIIGNVTNTGTISAFATAMVNAGLGSNQGVFAQGIDADGATFIGNITNTAPGVIVAIANAPAGGAFGTATGIHVRLETFIGNVNNTGTIMATGIGTGVHALGIRVTESTFVGNINNSGAGVILAKSSTYAAGLYIDPLTFSGSINNSALIIASGDATGIYSNPGTFIGAINNTGTIIGTGGVADRGIRVVGASITGGINNSGTIQGGFASIDTDQESGTPSTGTVINNQSGGLLKGDVRLSAWADTLNVFGGSTVMGNISGNTTGGGTIGNNDFVNFDLNNDGFGHTLPHGFSVYQYKITNVNTVDLTSGTLVLDDQDIVGTVTLGPGNIDPVGTYNQSGGTGISTLGLVVDAGHPTTLGPSTPPTIKTITLSTGAGQNIGAVVANTVNIGTGASFRAFPEADFYADTNIYPNVVVGLTSMNGNYAETNVTSNSPLLSAFMLENGGTGPAGSDTLILTRQAFGRPLGVGLTPNEVQAGNGLEGLFKTGNSTAFAVIPPLFGLNGPQYAAALKSLDGETILERPDLWQTVLDSILHRLSQGEGFNGQGVAGAMLNHGPIQVASAGFSEDDGQVAQMTPMPGPTGVVRPWSAWIRGYGVFASGPSTINATSFNENRYGGIGGIDYHVTDNLLVGGIFNYAHGEVTLDAPTPAKNTQSAYQFAAYGKYQQGPWYVNAVVGGGFTDNKETRQVTIPMLATVNGSYNGETFTAYGEAGWDLYPMNNVKLTPLVGVGYNWLRYDAFAESGSPSALHVSAATTNNLYTALGARAQTAINIGTRAPLVPELRVVWQHEFLDANQEMNAAFGGGPLFNEQGSKFSRESIIAGVGISNNVSPDLKLFLDYDAKIQGGYSAHAVSAGLRWSFGGAAPPPPPPAPPPVPAAQPAPPPPAQAQTFVVYFDFDKSNLTPEAMGIIRQAAAAYKQTGAVNLKVDGYTDLAGTAKYNIGLSKRRADVVRAELVKDGVPNNAVAEAWHGKDSPAVPTPDGVREPRNRRATIMLP